MYISFPGLKLEYGAAQSDQELSGIDDGCAPELSTGYDVPFFDTNTRSFFVSIKPYIHLPIHTSMKQTLFNMTTIQYCTCIRREIKPRFLE